MQVDSRVAVPEVQVLEHDQRYNFRCCICRKLSGHREKEISDLIADDECSLVWERFDHEVRDAEVHFIVSEERLFFRYLDDKYYSLTCDGPQFGASLRKIIDKFSIKKIYIEGRASDGSTVTSQIKVDLFRDILARRDITLNELRALVRYHQSLRLKSGMAFVGKLLHFASAHILTFGVLACSYIFRRTLIARVLTVVVVALPILYQFNKLLLDSGYDIKGWLNRRLKQIAAIMPRSVKTAFNSLGIAFRKILNFVFPPFIVLGLYHIPKRIAARLKPVASVALNYILEKAELYPQTTIAGLLIVTALVAEVALKKMNEEQDKLKESQTELKQLLVDTCCDCR